jgi:hypothetical protein
MKKFLLSTIVVLTLLCTNACQTDNLSNTVAPSTPNQTTKTVVGADGGNITDKSTLPTTRCPVTKYYFVAKRGDKNLRYAPFFEQYSDVLAIFQKDNVLYGIVDTNCKGNSKQIISAKAQGVQEGPCVKTEICVRVLEESSKNGKVGLLSMFLDLFD